MAAYIIITVLILLILAFSLRFTWWMPPQKGLVSFMYHNIDYPADPKSKEAAFFITPEVFAKQIDFMLQKGYKPINFEDLAQAYQYGSPLPKKPVLITFDDGYLNNYTKAFPILKNKNIKANIFLTYNDIGVKEGFLTWEQVAQMQKSGLISFGSHTLSHRRLRSLSTEDAFFEISESKKLLEAKLQKPVSAFCYPFGAGAFDKRIRPLVFKAGYLFDFSTKKGITKWPWNNKKTIKRAFPRGGETPFDFHLQLTRGVSKL